MKFLTQISYCLCLLFILVPTGAFAVVGNGVPAPHEDLGLPPILPFLPNADGPVARPAQDPAAAANVAASDPLYGGGSSSSTQLVPCDGTDCTIQMILTMGVKIYNYFTGFGAILAVGAIVWAGFSYIKAQGEPSQMAAAKQIIVNAIIGLVALAASALIVNTVLKWTGKTGDVTKVEDVKAK